MERQKSQRSSSHRTSGALLACRSVTLRMLTLLLLVLASPLHAQTQSGARFTVFYFGGTDCPFSTDEKNIANINTMRVDLPKAYPGTAFKFVMVVVDKEIDRGIEFYRKYAPWDEVSVGQFYNNELMLAHVNDSAVPGIPHIVVYSDELEIAKFNVPTIRKRTMVVDLVGESAIAKWLGSGYPLKR